MKKSSSSASSKKRPNLRVAAAAESFSWVFRANLPQRRGMPLPDVQKRNFFGIGEILSVLTNPTDTLRSLTETRKALEEARKEIQESRERAQLRTTHTFSPLPGFFPRTAELRALAQILEGPPAFTVLCGASSTGKTALLRELLSDCSSTSAIISTAACGSSSNSNSSSKYHVLHFDLRIAGFADLARLYLSLSAQMETYFERLSQIQPGYATFEREAWAFKHDRLAVERLVEKRGPEAVTTSDIARLMELLQRSLLHYWDFEPNTSGREGTDSEETKVEHDEHHCRQRAPSGSSEMGRLPEKKRFEKEARAKENIHKERPVKRIPVIFFDEAHKLPSLVRSADAMKCLLDSMLVLTKQDRLCHVVHATSDSFYQNLLRELNILQHCKILYIGDCSKSETLRYFGGHLLPGVPEELRKRLDFETLFDAFGGKLVHWADYISDFVMAKGDFPVERSSPYQQAYSLLNLQLIHAAEAEAAVLEKEQQRQQHQQRATGANRVSRAQLPQRVSKVFMPHSEETPFSSRMARRASRSSVDLMLGSGSGSTSYSPPTFLAMQLLDVMHRVQRPPPPPSSDAQTQHPLTFPLMSPLSVPRVALTSSMSPPPSVPASARASYYAHPGSTSGAGANTKSNRASMASQLLQLPEGEQPQPDAGGLGPIRALAYFPLCRTLGTRAVNAMVRARILELRWVDAIVPSSSPSPSPSSPSSAVPSTIDVPAVVPIDPADEEVLGGGGGGGADDCEPRVPAALPAPIVLPTTPILGYAMRAVLREYEYEPGSVVGAGIERTQAALLPTFRAGAGDGEEAGDEGETVSMRRFRRAAGAGVAVGVGVGARGGSMNGGGRTGMGYRDSGVQSDERSDYMSLSDPDEY